MDIETHRETNQEKPPFRGVQCDFVVYQQLTQEMLQVLRGSLTQRQLSQLLGYSFNQIGKWESGVTKLKWSDFVAIAEQLEIPLRKYLSLYFSVKPEDVDIFNFANHLQNKHALASLNNREITDKLKKWNANRLNPYFIDVLWFLDSRPSSLLAWLSLFVDCSNLPSIKHQYEQMNALLEAVADDPLLIFVNTALSLQAYQESPVHDEKFLAEHAAVSIPKLRKALNKLVSLGSITFDGQKYHPDLFDFSFSFLRHKSMRKFNKYTSLLAGDMYPLQPVSRKPNADNNLSRSSVRVSAISKEASVRIDRLVSKFHGEVNEIVRNDTDPKNNVQIIILHSFASNISPASNLDWIEEACNSKLPSKDFLPE